MNHIILASSSPYRRELLKRLNIQFDYHAPDVDESPQLNEKSADLALRLSQIKAKKIAESHPNQWIIGSDQTASINSTQLHKPGTRDKAIRQLQLCSNKSITFYTAVCLFNQSLDTCLSAIEPSVVTFRPLNQEDIEFYIDHEPAFDCAGGFKVEGLGISLFKSIDSKDPNAIIGLPLIKTCELLRQVNLI